MQANKQECQGCNVPQHGLYQISEPANPTPQELDPRDMSIWLLARRSYLGSHREAAEVCFGNLGTENWDRYTRLAEFFAAMAKQEKEPSASQATKGGA